MWRRPVRRIVDRTPDDRRDEEAPMHGFTNIALAEQRQAELLATADRVQSARRSRSTRRQEATWRDTQRAWWRRAAERPADRPADLDPCPAPAA
jgi:hypothetical protein